MGSILPDPTLQPRFNIAGDGSVAQDANSFPCEIYDFVVDSQIWIPYIAQANQRTVPGILGHHGDDWDSDCFVCEQGPRTCQGGACVRSAHARRLYWEQVQKFEIRDAGQLGLGVFAGRPLFKGEVLDEYFGELIPAMVASGRNDDDYSFAIAGTQVSSTSKNFGNWTRFVNHRCRTFNVEARNDVCGGRRTITFRALRSIRQGEQLFIDYGPNYFGDAQNYILCSCPDLQGQHLPPKTAAPKRKANTQATPSGREKRRAITRKRPDVSIPEKNTWITEEKEWLDQQKPNGSAEWTMVHWRLLEQLIRRRRNHHDWRDKREFGKLTSSRGDALINKLITMSTEDENRVTRANAQMTIKEWHLDVTKAFARDPVCGIRDGAPWGTNEILKRVFALVVAARRRRRRAGRKNSFSKTPPTSAAPFPGALPTPPSVL